MPSAKVTPAAKRALFLIDLRGYQGMSITAFAHAYWPDSPHRNESYRAGPYASVAGRGLVWSAGGYLGKLAKAGLVYRRYSTVSRGYGNYRLTGAGLRALRLRHRSP